MQCAKTQSLSKTYCDFTEKKKSIYEYQYLQKIANLAPGIGFGEIALTDDQPRTATIRCSEATELLTVTKSDYARVLQSSQNFEAEHLADYLKNLSFMQHIEWDKLKKLAQITKTVKFQRNEIVIKSGERVKGIYIVIQGNFEFSVEVCPEDFRHGLLKMESIVKPNKKTKNLVVSTISENEVFLFVDAMIHSKISHITVKSLSENGKCLYIPEEELMAISQDQSTKRVVEGIKKSKAELIQSKLINMNKIKNDFAIVGTPN